MSDTTYKTCLVLGANGFIGSFLVDDLARRGDMHVKAFDRFSTEPRFAADDSVEVVRGDVFNDDDLAAALQGVDLVIHSLSTTTPFISDQDPYKDVTDNLMRSIRLFELCAEAGVKKIGFISSAGTVYGSLAEHKVATEADAPSPVSPYGINKLSIEHYLEYFKRRTGMQYIVYRVTNPYGPRQHFKNGQGVIPSFIEKIQHGHALSVYGDGSTSRDYIYIEDAAAMIAETVQLDNKLPIYNIGSGVQTSLREIIQILELVMGTKANVEYAPEPMTFLKHSSVSIERFISEYGTREFTSLEDGLRKVLGK